MAFTNFSFTSVVVSPSNSDRPPQAVKNSLAKLNVTPVFGKGRTTPSEHDSPSLRVLLITPIFAPIEEQKSLKDLIFCARRVRLEVSNQISRNPTAHRIVPLLLLFTYTAPCGNQRSVNVYRIAGT